MSTATKASRSNVIPIVDSLAEVERLGDELALAVAALGRAGERASRAVVGSRGTEHAIDVRLVALRVGELRHRVGLLLVEADRVVRALGGES